MLDNRTALTNYLHTLNSLSDNFHIGGITYKRRYISLSKFEFSGISLRYSPSTPLQLLQRIDVEFFK